MFTAFYHAVILHAFIDFETQIEPDIFLKHKRPSDNILRSPQQYAHLKILTLGCKKETALGVYREIPLSLKSCKHNISQIKLKTKTIGW